MSMPEIAPTVVIDRDLAPYVTDYDVHTANITDYLRYRGLTDDDISELTIRFQARQADPENDDVNGLYIDKDKLAIIAHHNRIASLQEDEVSIYAAQDVADPDYLRRKGRRLSYGAASTLTHELEHYIIKKEGGVPEEVLEDCRTDVTNAESMLTTAATTGMLIVGDVMHTNTTEILALSMGVISVEFAYQCLITFRRNVKNRVASKLGPSAVSPEEKRCYEAPTQYNLLSIISRASDQNTLESTSGATA